MTQSIPAAHHRERELADRPGCSRDHILRAQLPRAVGVLITWEATQRDILEVDFARVGIAIKDHDLGAARVLQLRGARF